jgi:hypothetical protein
MLGFCLCWMILPSIGVVLNGKCCSLNILESSILLCWVSDCAKKASYISIYRCYKKKKKADDKFYVHKFLLLYVVNMSCHSGD